MAESLFQHNLVLKTTVETKGISYHQTITLSITILEKEVPPNFQIQPNMVRRGILPKHGNEKLESIIKPHPDHLHAKDGRKSGQNKETLRRVGTKAQGLYPKRIERNRV